MKFKSVVSLITGIFLLSACNKDISSMSNSLNSLKNDINWQITPNKAEEKEIKGMVVSYDVPDYLIKNNNIHDILYFKSSNTGPSSKQEKILVGGNNNLLRIERRTDNGAAGSGRVYNVNITKKKFNNITRVSFEPKTERKYQQGIVLPFAVPEFDIKKYLSTASISYSFELNSKYDIKSVKANFDRLLFLSSDNRYNLNLSNASYNGRIKFYPYRGGTKVIIKSTIYDMKPENNIIIIDKTIGDLKYKMNEIINS